MATSLSVPGGPIAHTGTVTATSARRVVRRLGGHLDVVRVALLEAGLRDPDELPPLLQFRNGARTHVEHRLPQPADELVGDRGQRPAVGDPPLDTLRNDHVVALDLRLEVPVLGVRLLAARGHRRHRSHAPVGLVLLSVEEDQLAGALVTAREEGPDLHWVA